MCMVCSDTSPLMKTSAPAAMASSKNPCAPPVHHATQFPIRVTEHERFATDFVFDRRGEMLERQRHGQRCNPAEILVAETVVRDQSKTRAELGVVAELGM